MRVEATTLNTVGAAGMRGPTPLLRLASDERLVALTRRGNMAAYEALVARYQSRLLAFCRHMLSSREDAEDVLQEVFAAAFNAMLADERPINVRPWLYRIARNRSLNHLRKQTAVGVDSMDVHVAEHGTTTAEKVHKREEFRQLMADVETLPETQRTALLLREIDALSYEQIAEAMDTTIPSVKSLLVRARVSLAEAAEARALSCEDVRQELGEVAEGLKMRTSPPVRRHLRTCERCSGFRKQLRDTNKALAAIFPIGPLLFLKKTILAQLGTTASAGGAAAGAGATGAAAGASAAGSASVMSAGLSAMATKTAAGLAAAALVTTAAVEVQHAQRPHPHRAAQVAAIPAAPAAPVVPEVVASAPQPVAAPATPAKAKPVVKARPKPKPKPAVAPTATTPSTTPAVTTTVPTTTTTVPATTTPLAPEQGSDTTTLPPQQSAPPSNSTTTTTTTPAATTTTPQPQPDQSQAPPQPAGSSAPPADEGDPSQSPPPPPGS
jgi:RNA polymerase sigma factor (sigma-70 family)